MGKLPNLGAEAPKLASSEVGEPKLASSGAAQERAQEVGDLDVWVVRARAVSAAAGREEVVRAAAAAARARAVSAAAGREEVVKARAGAARARAVSAAEVRVAAAWAEVAMDRTTGMGIGRSMSMGRAFLDSRRSSSPSPISLAAH